MAVVTELELSDCRNRAQLSELSDCRTCGRQWQTAQEHGTVELLSELLSDTVGHCRTVGLSDCRIFRTTVGLLSDFTVGLSDRGSNHFLRRWRIQHPRRQYAIDR